MRVTEEPEVEPVTLEEAKLFLRVEQDEEDDLIDSLVKVARIYAEQFTRRAFITQTIEFDLEEWPSGNIAIPRLPVQSVESITYVDEDGGATEFDEYVVDADEGVIALEADASWPTGDLYPLAPITVEVVVGYGDDAADVPEGLKAAIKMFAAHLYENREPVVVGTITARIPMSVESLLWQYRNLKAV